ncbi:HAD family phosphatase [Anaerococcus porci]|uniref:HAD family hydrolase n=1 Tax=Anaerococcus porci TaxID=2652269 RepID=A0A6N7VH70_9FIRM|nr:HAD family hydrolase [Anaerococcus porci]MDY3006348.1 HAD family hydrolase [Anaerococcus porci]MSS78775.1 HAD family hydrolase [Anaerococcus porci]
MKKLLFDCDGTILDSMHIWIKPINSLLDKYNYKITKEEKGEIESMNFIDTMKWLNINVCTDKSEDEVIEYFYHTIEDGYKNNLMPKEKTVTYLKRLKKLGYDMCICSSTDYKHLKNALERLDIIELFDFIHTPDKSGFKKSESEYWQYALDKYKIGPSDAVLFDDALYAVKSAGKVGIKTVGVKDFPYNENEWEDIKKISDIFVDNIAEVNEEKIENL